MQKRTAHRWRMASLMITGVVFALGSFWLVQVINRGDDVAQGEVPKSEPDYIVDKFSFVRMTLAGQPRYIVSGDRLTHQPSDDSLDVEQPVVLNLGETQPQPPMTMRARKGHIDQGRSVVQLTGDVEIERPQQGAVKSLALKTEALTLYTDEDRMETAAPFVLALGTTTVEGVGMKANNATGQFNVQGRSQLKFAARAR